MGIGIGNTPGGVGSKSYVGGVKSCARLARGIRCYYHEVFPKGKTLAGVYVPQSSFLVHL